MAIATRIAHATAYSANSAPASSLKKFLITFIAATLLSLRLFGKGLTTYEWFPLCKAWMKEKFSLVEWERSVYVFDLGSGAGILVGDCLTENAVNNRGDRDKKGNRNSIFGKFSPHLVLEKAGDVFHRLFLR